MNAALLDRLQKLLALSGSPNPHEAALAAARAQELVSRHRLEGWLAAEADPDPITLGREVPLEVARRTRKWKSYLASVLASANGCVAWVERRGREEAICLVGRQRDREVVQALWDGLVKRVEWASATAGAGRDRHWHEAFRVGLAEQIGERLREGAAVAHEALEATALTVVDPARAAHEAALDRFVAEHLGRGKGRSLTVDARGLVAGRSADFEL